MKCPKCGSENTTVQVVTETELYEKKHGILWKICIGWWWIPVKWFFAFLPALIVKIFRPKKYRTKSTHKSMAVCQDCGHKWEIKN